MHFGWLNLKSNASTVTEKKCLKLKMAIIMWYHCLLQYNLYTVRLKIANNSNTMPWTKKLNYLFPLKNWSIFSVHYDFFLRERKTDCSSQRQLDRFFYRVLIECDLLDHEFYQPITRKLRISATDCKTNIIRMWIIEMQKFIDLQINDCLFKQSVMEKNIHIYQQLVENK